LLRDRVDDVRVNQSTSRKISKARNGSTLVHVVIRLLFYRLRGLVLSPLCGLMECGCRDGGDPRCRSV
jgi:hypothetical protein